MLQGFHTAGEWRILRAKLRERRILHRMEVLRQLGVAQRAVEASWRTLARSREMVARADRLALEHEIESLADDLLAQERRLIEMNDDGTMLAAIVPKRRTS